MTDERTWIERLRAALTAPPDGPRADDTPDVDPEAVWRAVAGEADPDEVAALADRAAEDPELAEAWRLALQIRERAAGELPDNVVPLARPRLRRPLLVAAAAALVLAVGLPVLHRLANPPSEYRGAPPGPIQRVADEGRQPLSADRPVLRWTCSIPDATFEIVVTTPELETLAAAENLTEPRYRVPDSALDRLRAGETVLWQVWATAPDGRRIASPTFVERVR